MLTNLNPRRSKNHSLTGPGNFMRSILIATIVAALSLLAAASQAPAETIVDPKLGFTLNLPTEFTPRPDLVDPTRDIVHAFQFGEVNEGEIPLLFLVEKLGGVIGREPLKDEHMPPGFNGKRFTTTWQGFDVDGFKVPESVNGIDAVTYSVQIPLKREAIQIRLFAAADREETLNHLLRAVLDNLKGESNWLSSAAPSKIAKSENYGIILVGFGIGAVVVGLVILWLLSRRTPKGTVLVIAVVLYLLSWPIDDHRNREIRLVAGATRMLGIAGGILGVVDLLRKRRA